MAPEDTMPKPADNEFPDLIESTATGETDAAEDEDDEEMRGGGLPPARFPH